MNKKIKMIDLASNIAFEKWEEIPLKISFEGDDFIFDKTEKKYKQVGEDYICLCFPSYKLNDYVEILEDNTEEIEELDTDIHIDSFMDAELNFNKIAQEINKLGKTIKNLREEKTND